jgi:PKD repeat protein
VWTFNGIAFLSGFSSFEIEDSTFSSSGPWNFMANITVETDLSTYFVGLSPGQTYYWQETEWANFFGVYVNAISNTLEVHQPSTVSLSYTTPSDSSVSLSWTNSAQYFGQIGFQSYTVLESINGGSFSSIDSITLPSTTSYLANGLSASTNYSFKVQTTDNRSQSTYSNVVAPTTAAELTASSSSSQTSVDVGQTLSFTCSAAGGTTPYSSYTWSFGDGTTGSGASVSHSYSQAGTQEATCTVQDAHGSSASSPPTTITVYSDPVPTTPSATPGAVQVGATVTFSTSASGGSGGYSYSWSGLPSGCSNANAPSVTCSPSTAATYSVTVTVTDSNGYSTTSSPTAFTVTPASPPGSIAGIPPTTFYIIIGVVIAAIVVGVAIAIVLRRRPPAATVSPPSPTPPTNP